MRELHDRRRHGESSGGAGPLGTKEMPSKHGCTRNRSRRTGAAFLHQFEASATFADGKGYRRRLGAARNIAGATSAWLRN